MSFCTCLIEESIPPASITISLLRRRALALDCIVLRQCQAPGGGGLAAEIRIGMQMRRPRPPLLLVAAPAGAALLRVPRGLVRGCGRICAVLLLVVQQGGGVGGRLLRPPPDPHRRGRRWGRREGGGSDGGGGGDLGRVQIKEGRLLGCWLAFYASSSSCPCSHLFMGGQ
uniref:Uncharacterized protein n=1 Tax=Aegilops tauschii subsp. strangulata TaxID=200361 RepID=A0A453R2W1_AEGTS